MLEYNNLKKILITILGFLLLVGIVYFIFGTVNKNEQIACTMEAELCSDGSAVGRSGPNCEFAECPSTTSGISGYVHMGPTCPVEKYPPDPNCDDKPLANANINILIKNSGVLTNNTKSDANGNFLINLAPETYIITVHSQTNNSLPRCEEMEAIVITNKFTKLDISCDTGIR